MPGAWIGQPLCVPHRAPPNMKTKMTLLALGALMATAAVSNALSITPSSAFLINTGTDGITPDSDNPTNPESALLAVYGGSILYKSNVGGGGSSVEEATPFTGSYATAYNSDLSGATISQGGGSAITGYSPLYLLVKDGNSDPFWYFFNLTTAGWDGTASLDLSGFWPEQGSISHVTLMGRPSTSTTSVVSRVPDGGTTLATLGFALLGLGSVRRLMGGKA
jgi:hypothetical protein